MQRNSQEYIISVIGKDPVGRVDMRTNLQCPIENVFFEEASVEHSIECCTTHFLSMRLNEF